MLKPQGGEEHEREDGIDSGREATSPGEVVQPLCGCSLLSQSPVVVYSCPKCVGVAFRAMKEMLDA